MGCGFSWYAINKQFNKGFKILLCVIYIFSKYAWIVPLRDKKGVSIVNPFQKILNNHLIYLFIFEMH